MKRVRKPYSKKKTTNELICFAIGVQRRFFKSVYKTPFKLKKQIWYDEYSDADLFTPSCPHLHSSDGKYKLNVYNGEIYDIRLKRIVTDKYVPQKELQELWADVKFQKFAEDMRKIYWEKLPNGKLPNIPHFD